MGKFFCTQNWRIERMNQEVIRINARVCEVQREMYTVQCEYGNVSAKLKGTFYKTKENQNYPVVGDEVTIQYNTNGNSIIETVKERKSFFSRTDFSGHAAGYVKTLKEQVVAANFDYVFILSALNKEFNLKRITRYVSVAMKSGGKPVVVLTKSDLCEDIDVHVNQVKQISDKIDVIAISSVTGAGMEQLNSYMKQEITIVFLGSSGVGKSTLVNALAGKEIMTVRNIREDDSKGRHTTTHRQLVTLPSGVVVIDTPGMRELGLWDAGDGIDDTFEDITQSIGQCKYRNCSHTSEPGCFIRQALAEGTITQVRWNEYCKLKQENEWGLRKSQKK